MLRKKFIVYLLICFLIILLVGCSNNLEDLKESEVSLNLTGFPYGSDTYHLKVYAEGEVEVKNSYEFTQVAANEEFNEKIKVDEKANFIMVYLFSNKSSENPDYFWRFDIDSDKQSYKTSYWLDYSEFKDGTIEYGISKNNAQILETSISKEVNFDQKEYYLYKIPNVTTETWIDLNLIAHKGDININYAESLEALLNPHNYPTEVEADFRDTYLETIRDYDYNQLYILLDKSYNYSGEVNAVLDIIINGQSPVKEVNGYLSETIDFKNELYSVYKIPNMNSNLINFDLEVTQGEAIFEYAESLEKLDGDSYEKTSVDVEGAYTDEIDNVTENYEQLYIRVKPASSKQETTANLIIDFNKRTEVDGRIVDIVADKNNSEIVYALDEDNNKLYYIDSTTRSLTNEVSLADTSITSPKKMIYANSNLYIIGEDSSFVEVWDIEFETFNSLEFSGFPRDIAVDSTAGKIYLLSDQGMFILDVETGNHDATDNSITGNCIAYDEENKRLFVVENGDSGPTIYKYDNQLNFENSNNLVDEEVSEVFLSPDKSKLIANYDTAYDTTSPFDLLMSWTYGSYCASFSPDGSIFYATDWWDNYLYVQDGSSDSLIRKLDFPNAEDYSVFTPTSDGNLVVGFSYDDYYESDYVIYYFEDIKK